jgi:hypothetical protein
VYRDADTDNYIMTRAGMQGLGASVEAGSRVISPLASGAMWDYSHGTNSTAGQTTMDFGVGGGRLPYFVAMLVSVVGGVCVLAALAQERPTTTVAVGEPAVERQPASSSGLQSGLIQ